MTIGQLTWRQTRQTCLPLNSRRWLHDAAWERHLARPVQSYISTSRDPHLNLSIEHDILNKSARDSVVLFLYVNRPSIIIGRNQNPWLEVNLPLLKQGQKRPETEPPGLGLVNLVRRRSGGGTVFHDEGNVNWTIIWPREQFHRDKHAEMVVRALRSCGIDRARVNERHDIVLDQGPQARNPNPNDLHSTPYTQSENDAPAPLKVSGSAYKLSSSHRALHHGTCLLSSPNLNIIPDYLHSPLKLFIKEARGVPSVSSPVGNILLSNDVFHDAAQKQFAQFYSGDEPLQTTAVGEDMLDIDSIVKGREELMSMKWKYEQTPQFVLSNVSHQDAKLDFELRIRGGVLLDGTVSDRQPRDIATKVDFSSHEIKLHEIQSELTQAQGQDDNWEAKLNHVLRDLNSRDRQDLLNWLRRVLL